MTQGISIREPIWTDVFDDNMITVHPLGGCVMGDDAQHGVVNDRGQVTISALAERAMTLLIRDRGWTVSRREQGPSRRSGRLDG